MRASHQQKPLEIQETRLACSFPDGHLRISSLMFTAVAHKNLASAEGYFDEHLSQNDYYSAGELRPGQWIGMGAERLGLKTEVTREQFQALCENRNPQSGERLTQRQQAQDNKRVFYDFTCSAPKSVSVMAVTLDDERLVAAHEEAAQVAFRELETFAAARVRKQGAQTDRTTGNLAAVAFTHTSSRALDPQLHTHYTVFNATFDSQENIWKALQTGAMYDAIRYGTAVYRNELAKRIQEMGYHTVPALHGFEIEGVSAAVLKRFSKRSQQRDQVVKEMEQRLGRKLNHNEIAHAVHQSRSKKVRGISTQEVRERQLSQLSAEERQALHALCAAILPAPLSQNDHCENQALTHAIDHLFERKSIVSEHALLDAALSHLPGQVNLVRLKQTLKDSAELVKTGHGYSTQHILKTELGLIQTVNRACDTVSPLHYDYRPAPGLSEDQQRAIEQVLRTRDRITGLRGLAGSGKTTVLCELAKACHESGVEPMFCAPTAAATEVLRKEGFNARTLQSLLESKPVLMEKQLVVLDEAGAVGIDDMKRLFSLANNSRIVLSGDTGQHASVVRGDALRILERYSDFQSGQLTRIWRQRRADYRKAVELAARKDTDLAFAQLERMDAVIEVPADGHPADAPQDLAAKSYVKVLAQNKSALLVAPTWNEIEAVTTKVRSALKASGQLTGEEKEFRVFDSLSWTEAQKKDSQNYRPGQMLQFHKATRGFDKGDSAEVVKVEGDSLQLRCNDGSEVDFSFEAGWACFDVGESRKLKVAAGEKLMLQGNAPRKQFVNGEFVEVLAVQGDSIVLMDGRVIPANYRTFTHGYAVTSHAAQGKTVDEVLVVASSRSLPAVSQEQFYVSISRGRDACRIFTDDTDALRAHVTRSSNRIAAIESVPQASRGRSLYNILERGHRFLKDFRRRLTQSLSFRQDNQHKHAYEQQRQSRQRISI